MEEKTQTIEKNKVSKKSKIKPIYIVGIIVILAIIGASYLLISSSAAPVVAVGDTIEVNYTGTFTNGTLFDSSAGKQPLQFTVGAGQVIQGFDQGVVGLKLNQEKTLIIPANEAYGPINPALFIKLSKSNFPNQTVTVGMGVAENLGNQTIQGIVTAVNGTNVTVNFNPPLAGQTLIFKITVVGIQKNES